MDTHKGFEHQISIYSLNLENQRAVEKKFLDSP